MKNVSVIGSTSPLGIDLGDLLADQGFDDYVSYRTAAIKRIKNMENLHLFSEPC